MSKTFRRKNFSLRTGKVPNSKKSGQGVYTESEWVRIGDHPTKKLKYYKSEKTSSGLLDFKLVETNKPCGVYLYLHKEKMDKNFYRKKAKIHSDSGYGNYSHVPKFFTRFYNKKLKNDYKKYIFNIVKNEENDNLKLRIKGRSARYDYS